MAKSHCFSLTDDAGEEVLCYLVVETDELAEGDAFKAYGALDDVPLTQRVPRTAVTIGEALFALRLILQDALGQKRADALFIKALRRVVQGTW